MGHQGRYPRGAAGAPPVPSVWVGGLLPQGRCHDLWGLGRGGRGELAAGVWARRWGAPAAEAGAPCQSQGRPRGTFWRAGALSVLRPWRLRSPPGPPRWVSGRPLVETPLRPPSLGPIPSAHPLRPPARSRRHPPAAGKKPKPVRAEHKFQKKAARSKGSRGQRKEGAAEAYDGAALPLGKRGGLVRVSGY